MTESLTAVVIESKLRRLGSEPITQMGEDGVDHTFQDVTLMLGRTILVQEILPEGVRSDIEIYTREFQKESHSAYILRDGKLYDATEIGDEFIEPISPYRGLTTVLKVLLSPRRKD